MPANNRLPALACTTLLAALSIILYRHILFTPASFVYRDLLSFVLPMEHASRVLAASDWPPLWNPYQVLGKPHAADILMGTWYPPNYVLRLLPEPFGFNFSIAFHHFILALGILGLLRALALPWSACFFASAIGSFAGPAASIDTMANTFQTMAWMPWVFWRALKLKKQANLPNSIYLSICISLLFLGGVPELAALTFLAIFLSAYLYTPRHTLFSFYAQVLISGLCAAALVAIQLLPFIELLANSSRAQGLHSSSTLRFSQAPQSLIGLLLPRHYFNFSTGEMWYPEFWRGEFSEIPWNQSLYYGPALLLLPLAFLKRTTSKICSALILLLFPLLLSFGKYIPGAEELVSATPILQSIRYPEKALILFHFFVCIGISYGAAALQNEPASRKFLITLMAILAVGVFIGQILEIEFTTLFMSESRLLLLSLFALTLLLALSHRLPKVASISAAALCFFLIARAHASLLPTVPWREITQAPAVLKQLKAAPMPLRIYANNHGLKEEQRVLEEVATKSYLLSLSTSQFHNIANLNMPGSLNTQEMELLHSIFESLPRELRVSFLALFSVQFVSSPVQLNYDKLVPIEVATKKPKGYWYQVESALPRVYLAQDVISLDGEEKVLSWLKEKQLNLGTVLLAEKGVKPVPYTGNEQVQLSRYSVNSVEVHVRNARAGQVLVINDAYDKNWNARINTAPASILRANYFTRALILPEGDSNIELTYQPTMYRIGAFISVTSLLAMLLLLVVYYGRQKVLKDPQS